MTTLWDGLSRASHHHNDWQWLSENIEDIYADLRAGIHRPPDLNRSIDALLLIYPYLLTRHDLPCWLELLDDALNEAARLHDDQMQMQLWERIGLSYTRLGQPKSAQVAFKATLVRAQEQAEKAMMLRAYIGLFKIQVYYHASNFGDDLVNNALGLIEQVQDTELQASLHQALALAYTYREEMAAALKYGQIAYDTWEKLDNKREMAVTAYIMAVACRRSQSFERSDEYLEDARALFAQTSDSKQYALIAYEQGAQYVEIQHFEAAAQWLTIALNEYVRLGAADYQARHIAVCHHALALAHIGLDTEHYADAQSHVEIALSIWQKLDDKYEQAATLNTLGYIKGQNHQKTEAWIDLQHALQLCQEIPDTPAKQRLVGTIQMSIKEIE